MNTPLPLSKLIAAGKQVITFLLLTVIMIACVSKAGDLSDQNKNNVVALPGTPVDGQIMQPGKISDELDVTGTLVSNQRVDLVSELTRRIVKVNVKEGSKIKKGTLMFQLDDADLQAQLDRLHQQEKLARLNEERLKDLIAHDAIAQVDYDEASTNLQVLNAQVRELLVTIGKTRIIAPFDGQVGMINVHPGAIVSMNSLLTSIEDNSIIKIEFSVPEKYSNIIAIGSEQTYTIASDQKKHRATVIAKGASLNENTRTLLVRAITPNTDGRLLAGQSARLSLLLSVSSDAIVVASQALIPSSNGYSVLISRNNIAQSTPVEIGQRSSGSIEITKGLAKGDTVITSNLLRLATGVPVRFVTIQ